MCVDCSCEAGPRPASLRLGVLFMSCLDAHWLFGGDPHGGFGPINSIASLTQSPVTILLGDYGLKTKSLAEALAPARSAGDVYWIPGNHDYESDAVYDLTFGNKLAQHNLHGCVTTIGGVRVAGLGGHFQGRVWHPRNGKPREYTRAECLATGGKGNVWREGLPRKLRGAIWPEDVAALEGQAADVLVTHEAPSCHSLGFAVIDDLARTMGAELIVHGHTHLSYRFDAADGDLTVLGVGLRGVTDGTGAARVVGDIDEAKAEQLREASAAGRLLAGRFHVPALGWVW